ncbi:hypothetical protein B0T26DRAFT_669949 [Lasiosphaeria miniovina]|uniref:Uncharacterized protein n=1 Tax=Lasiosphaeria miniovina TaxID=1954250 RepID=A0AA40BFZ6_9PEZI|nr:uncharacterized protein B0T26DRAFT_669949 [Lasiosphaeria miniovina]KAK0733547.1 hypothetical protein B0T26DRAFT_669949 [Lasiosphaeria miniovina]
MRHDIPMQDIPEDVAHGYDVSPASSIRHDMVDDRQQRGDNSLPPIQGVVETDTETWLDDLEDDMPAPPYDFEAWQQHSDRAIESQPSWYAPASPIPDAMTQHIPVPAQNGRDAAPITLQQITGSQAQRELAEARAREVSLGRGPVRTSYGPAPVRVADEIGQAPPPVPRIPSVIHHSEGSPLSDGHGPFMHYEDLAYLDLVGAEPKDELHNTGLARTATTPSPPKEPARLAWLRRWLQRKRRRKGVPVVEGNGETRHESGDSRGAWRPWTAEILWCILSIVSLAPIAVLLKIYDGHDLPNWPLAVPLIVPVAFLTAICQVAMVASLAEGLAQLKWNSFTRAGRPLSDFQAFDDAGWGPVGSAKLFATQKGRFLGMSAAAVLLTSFASAPLTQAAISYPTHLVEGSGGTATVARSESYLPEANLVAGDTLDLREKQAIQLGLYHAPGEELPHVMPSRSSGECHWRNSNSLAVCAAVADVSDKLAVSSQTKPSALGVNLGAGIDGPVHNASLPNGVLLIGSPGTCNLNMSAPSPVETGQDSFLLPAAAASLAFSNLDAGVSSAVANFFVVYTTGQTANSSQH